MAHDSLRTRVVGLCGLMLTVLGCSLPTPRSEPIDPEFAQQVRAAASRPLALLQSSMQTWTEESTCSSCHHQDLGLMALAFVRERNFPVDGAMLADQVDRVAHLSVRSYAGKLQGHSTINASFGQSFRLLGLAAIGAPRSDLTDVIAHYLAGNQSDDGSYASESYRPPLEASPFTATAMTSRALALYGPEGRSEDLARRIRRACDWFERANPCDNEERVMKLLGLAWSGGADAAMRAAVDELLQTQNPDGGWAQIATRPSDAYATGQALVAMQQMGKLAVTSDAFQRGIRFLLDTQLPDGTWRLATRRRSEGLRYFETGFPHGEDQFISFAATAWAVMALAAAVDPAPSMVFHGLPPSRSQAGDLAQRAGMSELHRAAAFGTCEDLRRALAVASGVNAAGPFGVTPLMLAAHDAAKVQLLLDHGADANVVSETGGSALLVAAWYSGAQRSLELLLAAGADIHQQDQVGMTALIFAVRTGEPDKVERLLAAGARVDVADKQDDTALAHAVYRGHAGIAARLLAAGADVKVAPLLAVASQDNHTAVVRLLIERGSNIDEQDEDGMTPLAWAAKVDHGHSEILTALLDAGASPTIRDATGHTPLDWAEEFGNQAAIRLLAKR